MMSTQNRKNLLNIIIKICRQVIILLNYRNRDAINIENKKFLSRALGLILNSSEILTSLFLRDLKRKKKEKVPLYDELSKDLKVIESFHSNLLKKHII